MAEPALQRLDPPPPRSERDTASARRGAQTRRGRMSCGPAWRTSRCARRVGRIAPPGEGRPPCRAARMRLRATESQRRHVRPRPSPRAPSGTLRVVRSYVRECALPTVENPERGPCRHGRIDHVIWGDPSAARCLDEGPGGRLRRRLVRKPVPAASIPAHDLAPTTARRQSALALARGPDHPAVQENHVTQAG